MSTIVSAVDLAAIEFPDVSYWWGDLLRTKGRLSIIGQPKTAKSFFAIQLALHMATGTSFLGMDTHQAVVLYVNFEISEQMLQQRIDDSCHVLAIPAPKNLLLASPGAMALEAHAGLQELESLIEQTEAQQGLLDVLILDPRRQAMGGDENQSEIMTRWCTNVDQLQAEHDLATVIVHHKGKSTTEAVRGSSVYDGWLDTMLWLEPSKGQTSSYADEESPPDLSQVRLPIQGRDSEQRELCIQFTYPTWQLTEKQSAADSSRTGEAAKFIAKAVQCASELSMSDLRRRAMGDGHTNYAFRQALKRLVKVGGVEERKDTSKQGNHKLVRWVSPSE